MVLIDIDDEVHAAIEAATVGGEPTNQVMRRLLGLTDLTAPADPGTLGELADLIAAGLLAPGEQLRTTAPIPNPHPLATILADGRLRAADGTLYPGPRALITALRGKDCAAYGWHLLTTADGRNLETLRQRQLADSPERKIHTYSGALAPLIAAGLLNPDDELRMPIHRHNSGQGAAPIAVAVATVSDDGCFLLPDGSRHLNPSTATAACRGSHYNGWGSWAAPDGRRLVALRNLARHQ